MDELRLERTGRLLVAHLSRPHRTLSHAIVGGGFHETRAVAWCGVRDDELRPPVDARAFLATELERAGLAGAVGLLTSASLDAHVDVARESAGLRVQAVATVGLDNALRTGDPVHAHAGADADAGTADGSSVATHAGTINVLCRASLPLAAEALVEMLAMVAEARTLAVLEEGVVSRQSGRPATGTGTDCIVVAAPSGTPAAGYAGKHTVLGQLIGDAVFCAVGGGVRAWLAAHPARRLARRGGGGGE